MEVRVDQHRAVLVLADHVRGVSNHQVFRKLADAAHFPALETPAKQGTITPNALFGERENFFQFLRKALGCGLPRSASPDWVGSTGKCGHVIRLGSRIGTPSSQARREAFRALGLNEQPTVDDYHRLDPWNLFTKSDSRISATSVTAYLRAITCRARIALPM